MQSIVEACLISLEEKTKEQEAAGREELLMSAGLEEENVKSVSDEEFEAIKKAYNRLQETKDAQGSNRIADVLRIIAILTFVGGFILGLVLGGDRYGDFSFMIALICWVASWVSGCFVLGFAKIINLLQAIKGKK